MSQTSVFLLLDKQRQAAEPLQERKLSSVKHNEELLHKNQGSPLGIKPGAEFASGPWVDDQDCMRLNNAALIYDVSLEKKGENNNVPKPTPRGAQFAAQPEERG